MPRQRQCPAPWSNGERQLNGAGCMADQTAAVNKLLEALSQPLCHCVPVVKPTWSMVMMHLMCSRLTTRAFSRHRMAEG